MENTILWLQVLALLTLPFLVMLEEIQEQSRSRYRDLGTTTKPRKTSLSKSDTDVALDEIVTLKSSDWQPSPVQPYLIFTKHGE